MLTDGDGVLTGLFTDSDLARLLEQNQDTCFDASIGDYMTSNPITISQSQMLAAAVGIFSQKRISELPVVDDLGLPVGLVDITDTVAFLPTELSDSYTPAIQFTSADKEHAG